MLRKRGLIICYSILTVAIIWSLTPIVWMILSSLKVEANMFSMPPVIFFKPTLGTYIYMFTEGGFLLYLRNSLIAAVVTTFLSLILGTLGGYALARGKYKRQKDIAFWIISTRMMPIAAAIVPLYLMFSKLHLIGSLFSLIFAYTTFDLPFCLWIMMSFFADLPIDIEESAFVDGATKWQTFYKIVLPQVLPGFVSSGILAFMFAWNDFAFASVFTSPDTQTIPIAASLLVSQTGIQWGQAMAIGTIIVIPMLILGLISRRYLVRGLTMGALK